MTRRSLQAPADHFHPERLRLTTLRISLSSLGRTTPWLCRILSGAHLGITSALAAVIAFWPTEAFGLKEGFWSALTAIAVVQTAFRAAQTTARDQFVGATIGGIIGLCAALWPGQSLLVYALAVIASMLSSAALGVATASRLAGITATIILLVPHAGSPAHAFASRVAEVGWGICMAVVTVWLGARLPASHRVGETRAARRR